MDCPLCHARNPASAARCLKCDALFPVDSLTLTEGQDPPEALDGDFAKDWSSAVTLPDREGNAGAKGWLQPGSLLAGRYEIRERLGIGGMGSVYKARDRELDRFVAIKVIRPELAEDSEILRRFKQELILARQVTHRNVIRIFDLGEDSGTKFITMEYIDGQNLKAIVGQKGKLAREESVDIIQQVCLALETAHTEGVVHRDLKPSNIMLDRTGKVSVMDFGIARPIGPGGMTMTGMLVGTPEYMSPEQVKGEHVDARSDLFSLGIILYELLIGKKPYAGGSTESAMFRRTAERARPPIEADPSIPPVLSDITSKCLEIEARNRYQSARQIWNDLEGWKQGATLSIWKTFLRSSRRLLTPRMAAASASVLLVLGVAGFVLHNRFVAKTAANTVASTAPIKSLAIFPFRNASGDSKLDWLGSSIAQMLTEDVGQSARLRTVSADRTSQILQDLRIAPNAKFDARMMDRLAEYGNAEVIVWGQYAKYGDQLRIESTLQDTKLGRSVSFRKEVNGEKDVLNAVDGLAKDIRANLSLDSGAIHELETRTIKLSSTSLEALHHYDQGLLAMRKGDAVEASTQFLASTKEDPNFAMAFCKLGDAYALLGQDTDAEAASLRATELSQNLSPQEKYLISASHFRIVKDYPKAISGYEELAKEQPGDSDILFALATLYETSGNYAKAREYYARVRSLDPKRVDALLAEGRVEIEAGDPSKGLDYLSSALNLATQFDQEEQRADILQAMGVAYQSLNRSEEALRNFEQSLAIKRKHGLKSGIAESLGAIAQVQIALGKPDLALQGYTEALKLQREVGDKAGVAGDLNDLGNLYNDLGEHDKALGLFKEALEIWTEIGNEPNRVQALNNIGNTHLAKGEYQDAFTYLEQALQRREKLQVDGDIADTLHNLAEASVHLGLYDRALSQYLRALDLRRKMGDRRGAAIESYSLGTVFALRGRYGAALDAHSEALKTFEELEPRGNWMAQILTEYGGVLVQTGRSQEAEPQLQRALNLATELKSKNLIAKINNLQGDNAYYRGDYKAAGAFYKAAYDAASRTADREILLTSRFNLTKLSAVTKNAQSSIASLESIREAANSAGLKYLSLRCSIYLAKAQIQSKKYQQAQVELQRALVAAEKLGAGDLLVQCHGLLGQLAALQGNSAESQRQHQEAVRILVGIQEEAHTDLQGRSDIAQILSAKS
jgi:serine/threonine protein kinase/tetratricopeptide (TPR) repeat protein